MDAQTSSKRGANFGRLLAALTILAGPLGATLSARAAVVASAPLLDSAQQREVALRELQLARQAAEQARLAERAAKTTLDGFVALHFEEHRAGGEAPPPEVCPAEPRERLPPAVGARNPQRDQLKEQMRYLTERREELLRRVTSVHPEVTEIDERIAALSKSFAALGIPVIDAEDLPPGTSGEPSPQPLQPLALPSSTLQHYDEGVARLYQATFERWRIAKRNVQMAADAEEAAARRLAAIETPPDERQRVSLPLLPATTSAPPAPTGQPHEPSQALALAALLIALAVAALAAVRLARSDAIFSSAEDVAAALAVPVVGTIPAGASRGTNPSGTRPVIRGAVLLGEIVLAVFILLLIASILQNPALFWQFCTDPLAALREATDAFGVG